MFRSISIFLGVSLTVGVCGCAGTENIPDAAPQASFDSWGTIREVLRDGQTDGRVLLSEVAKPGVFGVGALEGLAAEVTIDDGVVYLSSVVADGVGSRALVSEDQATLLALARVKDWAVHELPAIENIQDLEDAIRTVAVTMDIDPSLGPLPVRVRGQFDTVDVHVLNGSCPIANPGGPPPAKVSGAESEGVLVGFYAEGQAGVLTHHSQRSHLHAIFLTADGTEVSGHLDGVAIERGTCSLEIAIPG